MAKDEDETDKVRLAQLELHQKYMQEQQDRLRDLITKLILAALGALALYAWRKIGG